MAGCGQWYRQVYLLSRFPPIHNLSTFREYKKDLMIEMDRFVTTLRGVKKEKIKRKSFQSAATMKEEGATLRGQVICYTSDVKISISPLIVWWMTLEIGETQKRGVASRIIFLSRGKIMTLRNIDMRSHKDPSPKMKWMARSLCWSLLSMMWINQWRRGQMVWSICKLADKIYTR